MCSLYLEAVATSACLNNLTGQYIFLLGQCWLFKYQLPQWFQSLSPVIGKIEHMDTGSPARPTPILNGIEAMSRTIEKRRNLESVDTPKPLELTEIVDPTQCRQVTMPDSKDSVSKVARLLYTNSGVGVLVLGVNGVHRKEVEPK